MRTWAHAAVAGVAVSVAVLLPASAATADPYVVRRGDTLTAIAIRADTSVAELVARNRLRHPDRIREGQVIDVPTALIVLAAPRPTAEIGEATSVARPATTGAAGAPPALPAAVRTYVVKPGDTMLQIAHRLSVRFADLVAVNHLADPNRLRVGMVLVVANPTLPAGVTGRFPERILGQPELLALVVTFSKAATEFGIPLDLLEGTAWVESAWDAHALSPTGAIGIGQLLPATAAWLAHDMMGEPRLDPHQAVDNIRMSARMLRWLLEQTKGNVTLAIEGYYQGVASVLDKGPSPAAAAYAVLVQSARAHFS